MDGENGEPLRAGFISPQPQPLTRGCLASLMWNLGASNYYDESRECAPDKGAAPAPHSTIHIVLYVVGSATLRAVRGAGAW